MTHLVVVGHGMAGARLVQEIRARDPHHRLDVTVLGAELDGAYNRVLLSTVLAGTTAAADISLASEEWYAAEEVTLRRGRPAVAINRERREVIDALGERTPYDLLVLATGSAPIVPAIPGLRSTTPEGESDLIDGVEVFRTLADCETIRAGVTDARNVVVLGGGLLGLEAARGIAGLGANVEVVHGAEHLMERQLDGHAGEVLIATMASLGVRTRVGAAVTEVLHSAEEKPRVTGLRCADGSELACDLLVLSCGVRPEVSLARDAGLRVDRGVVVDAAMRTLDDPAIFAIGECAEYDGQVYGLVAPAWEQARVLADVLTGADPTARYGGSRLVTRLKAAGIDLAAMGETTADLPGDEIVRFHDPIRGTYKKIVVRDGRLVGAILLGDAATAGTVSQLFDRQTAVPADRLTLLFDRVGGTPAEAPSPARMPASATVCQCNGVTKGALTNAYLDGCRSVAACADRTRATTGCGSCRDTVAGILAWLHTVEPDQAPTGTAGEAA